MACPSCGADNQIEYESEIAIRLRKRLDSPAVFVSPAILVCLYCGFTEFTVPESELDLLASGTTAPTFFSIAYDS